MFKNSKRNYLNSRFNNHATESFSKPTSSRQLYSTNNLSTSDVHISNNSASERSRVSVSDVLTLVTVAGAYLCFNKLKSIIAA